MILERYGEPSSLDKAPHKTLCIIHHSQTFDLYMQTNKNDEDPKWIFIGEYKNEEKNSIIDKYSQ